MDIAVGRFVLVVSVTTIREASTTQLNLVSFLIDMADQGMPHTAKASNSKKLRNRLKKIFGRGTSPDRPTSPSAVAVPADLVPNVTITTDPMEAANLRARYTHFRILVIGRANAGKTTLLKRVCNTKEDPVYSEVRYMCFTLYLTLIIPYRQINPTSKVPTQRSFHISLIRSLPLMP